MMIERIVTDIFLERVASGDDVVWSEAHDMAVELIKRRREEADSLKNKISVKRNLHGAERLADEWARRR